MPVFVDQAESSANKPTKPKPLLVKTRQTNKHNGKNTFSFEIFLFATKASTLTNDQTFYHPREAALELRIEIIEKLLRFQVYAAKSLLFRPCAFPSVLLIASLFSRVPPFSFPHSNFHYSEHFTGTAIAFHRDPLLL